MRSSFIFFLTAGLAACSGNTTFIQGNVPDAGSNDDAAQGQDAAPAPDSGSRLDSGTGVDGGPDCEALLTQLNALQAKAQTCCATCDLVQCYSAVPGMCCDISVTEPSSPATLAFESALTQYQKACPFGCPAIACPKAPTGICGASGECE